MLNKNTIFSGILLGLILPILSVGVVQGFFPDLTINHKRGIPYLFVIVLNVLLMKYFARKKADKTIQGIMLVTFIFAILIFSLWFKA